MTRAEKLKLRVEIPGTVIGNDWSVWIYPAPQATAEKTPEQLVAHGVNQETLAALAAGKRVLLLPPRGALKDPLPARFIPVFWSPLHFPNQPGTLGATIDAEHHAGKGYAGAAEIKVLLKEEGDVRNLGIVPGFNDHP